MRCFQRNRYDVPMEVDDVKSQPKSRKRKHPGSKTVHDWEMVQLDRAWAQLKHLLSPAKFQLLIELCLLECGGCGNCLFYVLATVLNLNPAPHDGEEQITNWTQSDIREWLANMLTVEYLTSEKLEHLRNFYLSSIDQDELERLQRDYRDEKLETKEKSGAVRVISVPDDLKINDLEEVTFKYGVVLFPKAQMEGIFDKIIFKAYLAYVCDKDKAALVESLQKHARHYSWQGDAFVLQVLSEYPLLRTRDIALVSVSIENTNVKKPIFTYVFPSFDQVKPTPERRYILCYNSRRTHWQLLGKPILARELYQSLFSLEDMPRLIRDELDLTVDERAREYRERQEKKDT